MVRLEVRVPAAKLCPIEQLPREGRHGYPVLHADFAILGELGPILASVLYGLALAEKKSSTEKAKQISSIMQTTPNPADGSRGREE